MVSGLGWWSPGCAGWPPAREALAAGRWPAAGSGRPSTALLPANERRRAPDAVLMALQVADEACAAAGVDRSTVASVFASAHGDRVITDALCRTLADDPALLSPMRFHHSVHNAAAGYWAMGAANHQAGLALAGGRQTWAAALLEAACQCLADQREVLLVGGETPAPGLLREVAPELPAHAMALLLAPAGAPGRSLQLRLLSSAGPAAAGDHTDGAPPLFVALADKASTDLALRLGEGLSLGLTLGPG